MEIPPVRGAIETSSFFAIAHDGTIAFTIANIDSNTSKFEPTSIGQTSDGLFRYDIIFTRLNLGERERTGRESAGEGGGVGETETENKG